MRGTGNHLRHHVETGDNIKSSTELQVPHEFTHMENQKFGLMSVGQNNFFRRFFLPDT